MQRQQQQGRRLSTADAISEWFSSHMGPLAAANGLPLPPSAVDTPNDSALSYASQGGSAKAKGKMAGKTTDTTAGKHRLTPVPPPATAPDRCASAAGAANRAKHALTDHVDITTDIDASNVVGKSKQKSVNPFKINPASASTTDAVTTPDTAVATLAPAKPVRASALDILLQNTPAPTPAQTKPSSAAAVKTAVNRGAAAKSNDIPGHAYGSASENMPASGGDAPMNIALHVSHDHTGNAITGNDAPKAASENPYATSFVSALAQSGRYSAQREAERTRQLLRRQQERDDLRRQQLLDQQQL